MFVYLFWEKTQMTKVSVIWRDKQPVAGALPDHQLLRTLAGGHAGAAGVSEVRLVERRHGQGPLGVSDWVWRVDGEVDWVVHQESSRPVPSEGVWDRGLTLGHQHSYTQYHLHTLQQVPLLVLFGRDSVSRYFCLWSLPDSVRFGVTSEKCRN